MSRLRRLIGVEPGGARVDAYRLLGLDPGEDDPGAIRGAVDRTRAILGSMIGGPDTAECRRLLDLVALAEATLTDPARKRAFDARLRGLADRPPPAGAPAAGPAPMPMPMPGGVAGSPGRGEGGPSGRRRAVVLGAAALGVGAAVALAIGARSMLGPARFPAHAGGTPPVPGGSFAAPRMPPRPPSPTVPGLALGVPRRVPGLESAPDASSPTLSSDLRSIVFVAGPGGRGGGPRLFLARREDPLRPFGPPGPVAAGDAVEPESSPSMAGDGLELAFLRGGRPSVALRGSPRGPFGPAGPLEVAGVDGPVDLLQLSVDGLGLAIRSTSPPGFHLASRPGRGLAFGRAGPMPVWSPRAANAFSADSLRDYAANDDGLSVGSRRRPEDRFGMPGLIQLLTTARVGPIVGPFWVAPREDLLVYSSAGPPPGPGRPKGDLARGKGLDDGHRSLWMARFR